MKADLDTTAYSISGQEHAVNGADGKTLPWTWADLLTIALLALGSVAAAARLWAPGIASEHDMLIGVYRVMELDRAVRQGVVFPRIGADLNFTYGAPLFQFYPPLASYVALLWHRMGLGLVEASKAVFTLNLLVGGLGVYAYTRWLFGRRLAALVAGGATVFAPYLLTVTYERGAMAEGLALALIPWVFLAIHRLVEEDGAGWAWVSSVLVALLVLAHNITALFALAAAIVYAVILAWRRGRLDRAPRLAGSVALGLGLSAFYWLPALAEARFTQMDATMFSGFLSAVNNLTPLRELIQTTPIVDYWGALRFRLALWPAVLGLAGLLLIPFQAPRLRLPLALLAGIWLVVMALQLTAARAFWELAPLVRFIQFPWRLLGLASFCIAVLTGSIFLWRPLRSWLGVPLAVALLAGIAFLSQRALQPDLANPRYPFTSAQATLVDLFERGQRGYALFSDYQPRSQQTPSADLARPRPGEAADLAPLAGAPAVQVLVEKPLSFQFKVRSDTPFPLRLHRIFFPGWRATVDGKVAPVGPAGQHGLVSVETPAGEHVVAFRYAGTPLQQVATAISLASLASLVILVGRSRRGRVALTALAGLVLALCALVVFTQGRVQGSIEPTPVTAIFEDEIQLVGYDLPDKAWRPGETVPLRLYWFAQQTPSADYKVFVHLVTPDDTGQVAQADSSPILGFSPTTRWEPGEVIVDEQQIALDPSTPPGVYRLVVGLYRADPVQNLRVSGAADVLPGDRVVLDQIEIQAP